MSIKTSEPRLTLPQLLARLEPIVTEVIDLHAEAVDREARFPVETIAALGKAGLLGLVTPAEHGGLGLGVVEAAQVVHRIAQSCGSSGMVVCMHYCAALVLAATGDAETNQAIARGEHLSTLAFSEVGSRSHFWAPVSTATAEGDAVRLDAQKSWVTSAGRTASMVWSSRPLAADGASTLWLVPSGAPGVRVVGNYDGLGLRGNASSPVVAEGALVPASARLGPDGGGFDLMMGVVLPCFNACSAGVSLGLMEAISARSAAWCAGVRYAHLGSALADLPTIRAYLAKMRIQTDMTRGLWLDTHQALSEGRPDTMLRVLEVKAAAGESALTVASLGMRVCGGAAYRREVGVERMFRDAQAASVMAPTTDVLYDFIGKAVTGLPLF
ncbi:acyl-CoA/acyl-ACP dehydrogenase [Myxococcota bacterium]|nr:acyl-CoA/acyl-ACP dehydrogenase [Myxococcota bacterium]